MKNTIFLFICALFFSFSVNAQSTVDSIAAKYQLLPMPEAFTIEKAFPVLGVYQLTNNEEVTEVQVTLDPEHKGTVWVEGLPEGKFKAFLKQSPATYRILSQKTESGKQIAEGTLVFDPETNLLQIAIGKAFDEANPTAIFALNTEGAETVETDVKVKTKNSKTKSKVKIQYYSASKAGTVQPEAAVQQDATSSL